MNTLQRRIKAVETQIKAKGGGLITAYYKDGTTRKVYPGEAIALTLNEGDLIARFEEGESGTNDGIVEGLVNTLLLSGNGETRKEGT